MTARIPKPIRDSAPARGAIAVVAAVAMVVLVLILGLVLDLGHLYVTKTELQNAADACALSAARELNDLGTGALDRATAAGVTIGNRHRVELQADAVTVVDADVTFSDTLAGPYSRAITSSTTYARCAPHETNARRVGLWFMTLGGLVDWPMTAEAVARNVGGQTFCAIPVAMCTAGAASDFVKGSWYSGRMSAGNALNGMYDWVRFDGQGAADLADLLAGPGMCNIGPERVDAEHGVTQGAAQAWNTRFGLYSGHWNDVDRYPPDRTGWAYTPNRLDNKGNVIPGSWTHPAPQNAYPDYVTRKNTTHDPFDPNTMLEDNGKPAVLPGNPAPLSRALHAEKGQDRRMTFVPIIKCSEWMPNGSNMRVLDWACALMLSPINDPDTDVRLEFRGLLSKGECGTTGVPGNTGPPVPALVR